MKANEFIKRNGWEKAKKLLSITSKMNMRGLVFASLEDGDNLDFEVDELKRLIESHELVELYGGVDKSHEFALSVWRSNKNDPFIENMKQAIADVESCQ